MSRTFHHPPRPHLDELDLSRTLELAAAVLGDDNELIMRSPRGSRVTPTGNAWPLWQSSASARRTSPQCNAWPSWTPPHGGSGGWWLRAMRYSLTSTCTTESLFGEEWDDRLHERLRWADAVVWVVTSAR